MGEGAAEGGPRTVQPAAMAGETLRVIMDMGKFQGVMDAATPTGCFTISCRLFGSTGCSTSPVTRRHSSANHSMDTTLPGATASAPQTYGQQIRVKTKEDTGPCACDTQSAAVWLSTRCGPGGGVKMHSTRPCQRLMPSFYDVGKRVPSGLRQAAPRRRAGGPHPLWNSERDSESGLPLSMVMMVQMSSWCATTSSYHLPRQRRPSGDGAPAA